MKIIITEEQLRMIVENEDENLLDFTPFMDAEFDRWDNMFSHLNKKRGGIYTGYYISGDLNLSYSKIETLGSLKSVGGYLDLDSSKIESLGNLKSVGGYLDLSNSTLSNNTTEEELRSKINVGGKIYL